MGIRILARKVMLLGMQQNKVLVPLLSYHYKHYYRIIFKAIKSKEQSSKLLNNLQSFVNYDKETANFSIDKTFDESKIWCGPLYDGPLYDKELLEKVSKIYSHKIITQAKDEITVLGSYDTHQLSQKNKLSLVSHESIINKLKEKEFEASRDSINLHAIKTNAPFNIIIESMKEIKKNS